MTGQTELLQPTDTTIWDHPSGPRPWKGVNAVSSSRNWKEVVNAYPDYYHHNLQNLPASVRHQVELFLKQMDQDKSGTESPAAMASVNTPPSFSASWKAQNTFTPQGQDEDGAQVVQTTPVETTDPSLVGFSSSVDGVFTSEGKQVYANMQAVNLEPESTDDNNNSNKVLVGDAIELESPESVSQGLDYTIKTENRG